MARYAISWEGVQALRTLSAQLNDNADDILNSARRLEQETETLRAELGGFEHEILRIIQKNKKTLIDHHELIMELVQRVNLKADEIEALLSTGLGMDPDLQITDGALLHPEPAPAPSLVPNRTEPRDLTVTRYHCTQDNRGHYVYDSPLVMDGYLYHDQGSADPEYRGTCGLCACVNIIRLAGVMITELEVLRFALGRDHFGEAMPLLCKKKKKKPGFNGGTSPQDRQLILRNFGIDSELISIQYDPDGEIADSNMELISRCVESGRGVILSVRATLLNDDPEKKDNDNHAVTVTSTVRDSNGSLLGFYIVDQRGTQYFPADRVKSSLTGREMNVTRQVIR